MTARATLKCALPAAYLDMPRPSTVFASHTRVGPRFGSTQQQLQQLHMQDTNHKMCVLASQYVLIEDIS